MATRSLPARVLRWVLVLVVVLLVVLHVGGGWFFSSQIRSDVLAVAPYEPVLDLTVRDAGDATITLADRGEPDADLHGPETYGVVWERGYGRISGAPREDGDEVTRAFEVLQGRPPEPGDAAGLDRGAFPPRLVPPSHLVTYAGPLGPMDAVHTPGPGHVWAVLVHGKGGAPDDSDRMRTGFPGMPTLAITYRNDPGQPPDPSGEYRYGRTEWADLAAAIDYAAEHGAHQVVLGGESMGGAVIASYLRHVESGSVEPSAAVVGLVLDAPMLDLSDTISWGAAQRTLPGTPVPVPPTLALVAKRFADWRFGLDLAPLDYLDDTSWLTVPTLLFSGDADLTVPVEQSRDLAAAAPEQVRYVEVSGTGHVESWNTDPRAYQRAERAFLCGPVSLNCGRYRRSLDGPGTS